VTERPSRYDRGAGGTSVRTSPSPASLRGRWLIFARATWVALAAIVLALNAVGLSASYAKYESVCRSAACAHPEGIVRLTPEGVRALRDFGLSPEFYGAYVGVVLPGVVALTFAIVAGVIIWHKSDERMAVFAAFALLLFGGVALNSDVSAAAAAAFPALWLPIHLLEYAGQVLYTTFFYVFPDGRFVPRWARWLVLVWAVLLVPSVFFPSSPWNLLDGPLFFGLIGGAVLAQLYRYLRVSTPVHRQQTKWVVFGIVLGGAGLVGTMTLVSVVPAIERSELLGQMIGTTLTAGLPLLVPLSIGVAMVRSGLYEIDVIINRTLVYGSLTATLVVVYLGCVIGLQYVFRALTLEGSNLTIVASTLLIAALFAPLRRRIQSFIDRSFYRRKYDARKTLEAFSTTLREETELGTLSEHLVGVVSETMQPSHVSLWLRPEEASRNPQADQP
jgi:hypothetical protein